MRGLLTLFFICLSLSVSEGSMAQNTQSKPCDTEEYKQFDFWLGNWNVFDINGKLIGKNNIIKVPNACAIQENWDSNTGPSLGTSYNFYNSTTKKWHQVWIDNSGFSLFLKGNYTNNKMILSSEIQETPNGKFYNRITWTKNSDGSVTQVWDYMSPENKVLKEAFRGIYKKNNN